MRNIIFKFRQTISIYLIIFGLRLKAYNLCALILWFNIRKIKKIDVNYKSKNIKKVLVFPKSAGNEDLLEAFKNKKNNDIIFFILPRRFLIVGSQDIIMPVVCWESCKACNDFPQPPIGISCNTGYPGVVFSDDCEAQGNWTGDFGTGNGIWQLNSGGTASGGTGPDAAHSGSSYFFFESSPRILQISSLDELFKK